MAYQQTTPGMRSFCLAVLVLTVGVLAQTDATTPPAFKAVDKDGRAQVGDVIAPTAIHAPDPEYTEGARRAQFQGQVWIALTVGTDGLPYDFKVVHALPFGLTDKAVETVKTWTFQPGMKNGKPVNMRIQVEVDFRLMKSSIGQVNLVTDATGVQLNPYVDAAMAKIYDQWMNLEPEEQRSPFAKKGEAWIEFTIRKDGHTGNSQITAPSSDASLDKIVLASIAAASPFQPLPPEFQGNELTLKMQFLYQSGMEITPPEATLAAGKAQQFSASLGATSNPPVSWTIEGPGCTASACGTISADGLYTAPADAFNAQKTTIKATLSSRHQVSAQALVVIGKE